MLAQAGGRAFQHGFEGGRRYRNRAGKAHVAGRRRNAAFRHVGNDGRDDGVAQRLRDLPGQQPARTLCLPSAIYGPLCSTPPIGTSTVVAPWSMRLRSSVLVSSSSMTLALAGAAARADAAASGRTGSGQAAHRRAWTVWRAHGRQRHIRQGELQSHKQTSFRGQGVTPCPALPGKLAATQELYSIMTGTAR
jgi:hypothetical protein